MAFGLIPSVTQLSTSKAFQMSGLVLRCSRIFTMSNSTAHAMTASFPSLPFYKTLLLFIHKYLATTVHSVNIWCHSSFISFSITLVAFFLLFLLLSSRNTCLTLSSFTQLPLSSFSTPFLASGKLFLVEF